VEVFEPASPWSDLRRVLSLSLSLSRSVVQSASLSGIKQPFGAYDQIFITVRQLGFVVVGRSL
jgi:hypothetical protein